MRLNTELNVVGLFIFILLFIVGGSQMDTSHIGYSLMGFAMMLLGGLGLLSQFILFNIVSMKNKNGQL